MGVPYGLRMGYSRTSEYAHFGFLNDRLLGYELNVGDGRNHGKLHVGHGWGVSAESSIGARWSARCTYGQARFKSTDRETWQVQDPRTGETRRARDSQRVLIDSHAAGLDVVRDFSADRSSFGLSVGALARWDRMTVDYAFDGARRYEFRTDMGFGCGVRAGVSCALRAAGPITVDAAAGVQAVTRIKLTSDGLAWWWTGPEDQHGAYLQPSGAYWRFGLGLAL